MVETVQVPALLLGANAFVQLARRGGPPLEPDSPGRAGILETLAALGRGQVFETLGELTLKRL